jgi:hypothetical protein
MSYGTVQAEKMTTESGYSLGAGNATSFKNRIINGAMTIDQRNAGASVTPATASVPYTLDRWQARLSQGSKLSFQQSTTAPSGFVNSILITSTSAYSVTSIDNFAIYQAIEGFNTADLGWGTANAQPVTLSFWVRSSLTGTFGGAFSNENVTRSYPFTYTISAANTWEQKSLTIAGDTAGTWGTGNSIGIRVWFNLGTGSTYNGTAGSWAAADYRSATGATSVVGTSGATFNITGVQLEVGTVATSFDFRSIGTELALCQRYYQTIGMTNATQGTGSAGSSGSQIYSHRYFFPVTMRSAPAVTYPAVGQTTGNITYLIGGSYPSPAGGTIGDQDVEPGSFNFSIQHNAAAWATGQGALLFATGASEFKFSSEL